MTDAILRARDGTVLYGVQEILDQRRHQVDDEGFSVDHDRAYTGGQLVNAALFFLTGDPALNPWPGTRHVPGKKGRVNDLAKAGAFIAAEIDRRRRGDSPPRTGTDGPLVADFDELAEAFVRLSARTQSWRNREAQVMAEAERAVGPRKERLLAKAEVIAEMVSELEGAVAIFSAALDGPACHAAYQAVINRT